MIRGAVFRRRPRGARRMHVWFGLVAMLIAAGLAAAPAQARFAEQAKLVGTGANPSAQGVQQGTSVALSADGSTAIVGGPEDNGQGGAAWVFIRAGGVWTQQAKLVGGTFGPALQGHSVALSADGNTAIVGGYFDAFSVGAAWVFTRSGGVWTQQAKLVGTGGVSTPPFFGPQQGFSVALSADGNTAIIGGNFDNTGVGATWVFTRAGNVWTQQGNKLVGTGAAPFPLVRQGSSVALSADGNTFIVGGEEDNGGTGAAWVFVRSGATWMQQGEKLVGTGAGGSRQGFSVALSADGNTAIVGGPNDNGGTGAAWVFTRSGGVWTQQGGKLVGSGGVPDPNNGIQQGRSVRLSADGNTAIVGGPFDNGNVGAAWVFLRRGGMWIQQSTKRVGKGALGNAQQGYSVALSADGDTAIVGGRRDNGNVGAAWVFVRPGITAISPSAGTVDGGTAVTISGRNFFDVISVTFGGVPATNVIAVNPNTVLATTPPHTAGAASVFLTTRTGRDRALHAYTYQRQPTAVQLTSTPNPSSSGQPVTFTALVTAGSGGAASGSVVFTNDTQPLATVTLRNGLARFSTDALAVGSHRIRARFVPNGTFEGSSSHLRQLVRN